MSTSSFSLLSYELKAAISSGKLDKVIDKFSPEAITAMENEGENPLFFAIISHSAEILDFLFENMTDLSLSNINKNGSNFLHMVVDYDKGDSGKMVSFLNKHSGANSERYPGSVLSTIRTQA